MDLATGGWIRQNMEDEPPPPTIGGARSVKASTDGGARPVEEGLGQAQTITSVTPALPAARPPCHFHPTAPYRICSLHPAASTSQPMVKKGKAAAISTSLPMRKKGKAVASR